MLRTYSIVVYLVFALLLVGCSVQEGEPGTIDDLALGAEAIKLSIDENGYLDSNMILITLPAGVPYDTVNLYLDSTLVQALTDRLDFTFDVEDLTDGAHELKIEVVADQTVIGTKILQVKVDNNGPTADFGALVANNCICENIIISPEIVDKVSNVETVKVFLGAQQIAEFAQNSDYSITLDPKTLPLGAYYLKLEMQDERGHVTQDSVQVHLGQKLTQLNFPDGFIRPGTEKMHVLLSDANGSYISGVTHSSGAAESLSICSTVNMDSSDEFILTFVSAFVDQIYYVYSYSDLTPNSVGPVINLAEITSPNGHGKMQIALPDHKEGDYVRGSGGWSTGLNYQGNIFEGTFSTDYTNEDLATDQLFLMNYNRQVEGSYKWALIQDPLTYSELGEEDFTSDNVINSHLGIVGSNAAPFLAIYGFGNETLLDASFAYLVYWNSALNWSNGYDYSYANIFPTLLHSVKVANYGIDGIGPPPTTVSVPDKAIDFTFSDNTLYLSGLSDFEVGRAQFTNTEDAHIYMEMYFDGNSSDGIVVPEFPEWIGKSAADKINNGHLEILQVVVENYDNIADYDDYISKIMVPSVPFYNVSSHRERIFRTHIVGNSFLPMTEFPFYGRF